MFFLKKISILTFAVLLAASASHAYFKKNDTGEEVFSFLGSFYSAKSAAMENANAAMPSSNPGSILQNPAAIVLDSNQNNAIAFSWQTGEFADNQGYLAYARQIGTMVAEISYGWIRYGDIDGYDEAGNKTNKTYSPQSSVTSLSLSLPLPHFQFGSTIKFATDLLAEDEGDQTAMAIAFDWGILWQSASRKYGVGLAARNFGKMIRAYVDNGDTDYGLEEVFAISGFYIPGALPRLSLFTELTFPRYAEPAIALGTEYAIGSNLFVRAGFTRTWLDLSRDAKELFSSASRPDETNNARLFSLGLGYAGTRFSIDYAFSYLAQGLGTEHRVGLGLRF
ncbi:MAG: hypothetical protein SPL19_06490 [Fibrobacter sp.]|nr:hypothetical protein [Fibrobacter sp.]MDY6370469.1 hypothetical protein [Fibrobacter sp.]MDY6389989.1 hypothetical protein [Fibrobacter sp.]